MNKVVPIKKLPSLPRRMDRWQGVDLASKASETAYFLARRLPTGEVEFLKRLPGQLPTLQQPSTTGRVLQFSRALQSKRLKR